MARKVKLDSGFEEDITIIGISCHKIDYWIARLMNEKLKLKLSRQPDLLLYNEEKKSTVNYPLFTFSKPEVQTSFSFISNHNPEGKLFPGQKSFDYFLLIKGRVNLDEVDGFISIIKKIPQVLTAHNLNLKKIKNLPEFLSDLELHLLKIEAKKKNRN